MIKNNKEKSCDKEHDTHLTNDPETEFDQSNGELYAGHISQSRNQWHDMEGW